LTLNSSGNVGIGAAPIYRAQVTAAATNGSVVALGIENPQAAASANLNATVDLRFDLNGSGAAIIRAGKDGDYMNDTNCDGNLQFYTNLNNQFALSAPVERMRLDSNGNLTVSNGNVVIGTAGKGIDFSITASGTGTMTSELLADYEEGTWTPSVSSTSGTITTVGAVSGTYTKVGRVVHANLNIAITTNGTGGTNIAVTSLPFTPSANQCAEGVFKEVNVNGTTGNIAVNGTTEFILNKYDGTYPGVDGCKFIGTISYIV